MPVGIPCSGYVRPATGITGFQPREEVNDIGMQLGWSGDKTKNIFSGRTRLSSDDVLNILSDPNIPISDFKRYRMFRRIRQALLASAEGHE